ncbi:MAG: hypothetical protein NT172_20220 [Planctomycetota bacterium]|nr:hypothetical protein [Planctomycetota bacterium]
MFAAITTNGQRKATLDPGQARRSGSSLGPMVHLKYNWQPRRLLAEAFEGRNRRLKKGPIHAPLTWPVPIDPQFCYNHEIEPRVDQLGMRSWELIAEMAPPDSKKEANGIEK